MITAIEDCFSKGCGRFERFGPPIARHAISLFQRHAYAVAIFAACRQLHCVFSPPPSDQTAQTGHHCLPSQLRTASVDAAGCSSVTMWPAPARIVKCPLLQRRNMS